MGKPNPKVSFLKSVVRNSREKKTNRCIDWPYPVLRSGYGYVWFRYASWSAGRFVLAAFSRQDPKGLHAAHTCGNRACINPDHLYWATPTENNRDKRADGTQLKGEEIAISKLTEKQVLKIYSSTEKQYILAKHFSVSESTICNIKKGRAWGWLTEPSKYKNGKTR